VKANFLNAIISFLKAKSENILSTNKNKIMFFKKRSNQETTVKEFLVTKKIAKFKMQLNWKTKVGNYLENRAKRKNREKRRENIRR
jgi:hypothetical protein